MTDKELCRVLVPLRSLDNKNLCVSFVAVCDAPRGLRKGFAQVVWLKDGASSVTCLASPEPGVFLRLSSLVTRARESHSRPLWMTKVKFQA